MRFYIITYMIMLILIGSSYKRSRIKNKEDYEKDKKDFNREYKCFILFCLLLNMFILFLAEGILSRVLITDYNEETIIAENLYNVSHKEDLKLKNGGRFYYLIPTIDTNKKITEYEVHRTNDNLDIYMDNLNTYVKKKLTPTNELYNYLFGTLGIKYLHELHLSEN